MVDHLSGASLGLLVACLLTPSLCWSSEAGTYSVRSDHPRLLITRDDLSRLHRQVAAYPDEWRRVTSVALYEPSDPGYGDARAIRNAALAYLVTQEERYLRSTVAFAEHIARQHTMDRYASPEALFGLALAYDWCYSALSEEQRREIADCLLRLAEYLDKRIWRHSDFNNHFALEKVWPFVFVGLALHGDTADPRVSHYLALGEQYLNQQLIPAANLMAGSTGGQFEGYGYDSWGYMRPLAFVMEAWRTATGADLFGSCTAARYHSLWNIDGRRPLDGNLEHLDDASLEHRWTQASEGEYIYLLAYRYRDRHAQWMGDQIPRRYDSYLWPIVLWRDPELAPEPPDGLPLASRFDSLGWVLMRSSWEADATFASFQCGPFYTGHQHLDNNAFTIHRGALLAIDPGINAYGERVDDRYRTNYYARSIAHNTVTVFDPAETFPDGPWASGPPGAANDGGQLRLTGSERVEEIIPGNRWEVGHLTSYAHSDLFTYAAGDATRSYSSAKLGLFLRQFLYLPPDLFVVFDRVASRNPGFRKAWLLHSVNEPVVERALTTIANGEARLLCRTVLPSDPAITKIGGPGQECWVDGRNWPSQEKREWPPEAGSWRLEVSPSKPAAEDVFLHVIEVGGDEIASPDAVTPTQEEGQVGVEVKAQGREYAVVFATEGPAAGHLRIREGERVVLDQELR